MTTPPPTAPELIRALVEIIEQAFDGAGNAFSDPRWAEVKAVREARLWLAVHEAEQAGQKLAGLGYAHRSDGRAFYRPGRHEAVHHLDGDPMNNALKNVRIVKVRPRKRDR